MSKIEGDHRGRHKQGKLESHFECAEDNKVHDIANGVFGRPRNVDSNAKAEEKSDKRDVR